MTLIAKAKCGDKYIDYILEKEQYVHDQHRNNCTRCVSRFEVYNSLSTVKSYDGIKKLLSHKFSEYFTYHSFDWTFYSGMMENCLSCASRYIGEGHTDLIPLVKRNYINLFDPEKNYYSRDCDKKPLQYAFRQLFKNTGLDVEERQNFKPRILALLKEKPSYKRIHDEYVLSALWLTKEDAEGFYSVIDISDDYEIAFVKWLERCPNDDIQRIAQGKNASILPEADGIRTMRQKRESCLRDFADYSIFKKLVFEFADKHTKRVRPYRMDDNDEEFNEYVLRFCSHYTNDDDLYVAEEIIEAIDDKYLYDTFFMSMIKESWSLRTRERVPEEYLGRCIDTAKETLTRYAQSKVTYFIDDAIKILLSERFNMPLDVLVKLLKFASVSISIIEAGNFSQQYSLFDYLSENVTVKDIADPLIEHISKNHPSVNHRIVDFARYIINRKIVKGYDVLLEYISSDEAYATSIADIFIENSIHVDSIKCISENMTVDFRLSIYSTLIRHGIDTEWVVSKLEPVFRDFTGSYLTLALKLLLGSGSLEALSYIVNHIDKLDYRNCFIYNYSNSNAVCMLVTILEHFYSKDDIDYLNVNSIFSSLERIALQSREQLNEVKSTLLRLVSKNEKYKFINIYIIAFEQKYYESNVGIGCIDEVMNIIDSQTLSASDDNGQLKLASTPVYVSYNWEKQSDSVVNHLCYVLENNQIECRRDKTDCNYIDNIKEFMKAIQQGHFIIVVLSKPYLKSQNCMFELTGIMKHGDYQNRILPIVVDDTIRDRHFYVELCKHWSKTQQEISSVVSELEFNKKLAKPFEEELRIVNSILDFLPQIKTYIDWTNAQSLSSLTYTQFKPLIDIIKASKER